jgi:uncharacterized protein (DUF4415 family)
MSKKERPPLTDEEGNVRPLTREDFKGMRPLIDVYPEVVAAFKGMKEKRGRPMSAAPKRPVSLRLSPEVLDYFKETGPGWQTRINNVLSEYVGRQ